MCPICKKRGSKKFEGYCKACYDYLMNFDLNLVYPDKIEEEFEGLFSNVAGGIRQDRHLIKER